jgi:hypothetical protein
MIRKLERDRLAAEIATVDTILAATPTNDVLGRLSLTARRKELQEQFASVQEQERSARVALYFGGDPVIGSLGIQAGFATKAVGSFQDLLSKVWSTLEGGSLAAAGPVADRSASQLHITELVHGSFGFLLEEIQRTDAPAPETPLRKAADQVAELIAVFAGKDDQRFLDIIDELNPRVFSSLRQFFACVYRDRATFRLVEEDLDYGYDREDIERAWRRAEESDVTEDPITVDGRLLGVIPITRRFEFQPRLRRDGHSWTSRKEFSQSYLEQIRASTEQPLGKRWHAVLQKRVVKKPGRIPTTSYTLLKLDEIGSDR